MICNQRRDAYLVRFSHRTEAMFSGRLPLHQRLDVKASVP